MFQKNRKVIILMGALVICGGLAWIVSHLLTAEFFFVNEFVEYWAPGRINLFGQNPYDPVELFATQNSVGWQEDEPMLMWNPPWTLALAMPFALIPYRLSWLIWMMLSIISILVSCDWIWRLYGGSTQRRWVAGVIAFTFAPTILALILGQITPWIFLGLTGFLYFERKGQDLLAGMSTFLVFLKPHLLLLFLIVLFVWSLLQRRWRIILGVAGAGMIATILALITNPKVLNQYAEALLYSPPNYWMTATFGAILRKLFDLNAFWLQFVPPLVGGIWCLLNFFRRQKIWDWQDELPLLVLVSVITAAYGWTYDWIVLLLPVIQAAIWLIAVPGKWSRNLTIILYFVLNIFALAQLFLAGKDLFWHIWLPILILGAYLFLRYKFFRDNHMMGSTI